MVSVKQQIKALIAGLPDDVTLENVQYHLDIRQKVERSLKAAGPQGTLSHEQVEAEMWEGTKQYGDRR